MNKPFEKLTALEKVAILLIALGKDTTAEILKYMTDGEAEKIVQTIAEVEHVETELMDQVLEDFEALLKDGQYLSTGGSEFARAALELAMGPERAQDIMDRIGHAPSGLDMLRNADARQILPVIRKEHAQTIALILTQVDPALAADILTGLEEDRQADVIYRMATMHAIEPETLRELEDSLSEDLQAVLSGHVTDFDGPKTVADILNRARQSTEINVLDDIAQRDPELADSIRGEMFVFEDVAQLTDADVRELMRHIDPKDLALALKTAGDTVKDRFFRNLSQNRVAMLKEDIAFMGQVRLSDVQAAQQKLAQTARELQEGGQIRIIRADSDDVLT